MTNPKVTKNTIALITREALNKGTLFILLIFIARFLGKEALGIYSLAIVISQIFFFGTELGLNTLLIREVSKEKSLVGAFVANVGILRIILGAVTMFLIWLTTLVLGAKGETAAVIYLCGISYVFVVMTTLYTSIFRAFEKMELELLVSFIKNIIFLPIAMWLLFNHWGLIAIFNVFLLSNILALVIAHVIFVRKIGSPKVACDFTFLKAQLIQTLPLWISQLLGIAYLKLAPLLLFRLKGEAAVGLYNAGFVVVDGFWILASCFVSAIFPMISRFGITSLVEARREYLNGLRSILLIFIPAAIIIIFSAGALVLFFYGAAFAEITPLFRFLAIAAVFVAVNTLNSLSLIAIGKQFVLPFVNGAGLLINFIFNLYFISRFNYIGSSYALIISEFLIFAAMAVILKGYLLSPQARPQVAK